MNPRVQDAPAIPITLPAINSGLPAELREPS